MGCVCSESTNIQDESSHTSCLWREGRTWREWLVEREALNQLLGCGGLSSRTGKTYGLPNAGHTLEGFFFFFNKERRAHHALEHNSCDLI